MTAVRHKSTTVATARRLHAGGWSVYAIVKLLRREGVRVEDTTVAEWVDQHFAARRRQYGRERKRRINAQRCKGRLGAGPPRSPEFRQVRIESLRALGVSCAAIAKVMTFDFPDSPVTERDVRYALDSGRLPVPYRETATT